MQINSRNLVHPKLTKRKVEDNAIDLSSRWQQLCDSYLPFKSDGTFWRVSRNSKPEESVQGWKLHISVTVVQACDLFEKVMPFLASKHLRFKAPESLKEIIKLNSGLDYGYWQVGKILTIYPTDEKEAVELARELHELTSEFISIAVPFDKRYLPDSSVFYRYGAYEEIEIRNEDGLTVPALKNPAGELVYDDRFQPVPEWLNDPFQAISGYLEDDSESIETPLLTTYRVFRAITQRGKGGVYQAFDFSVSPPRFCIVKEGRQYGELSWNWQDGYQLVKNEKEVLENLGKISKSIPQYFSSFEAFGNFYLVMEYVEGKSLRDLMKFRQRRFPLKQTIKYAVEIAGIIDEIHKAGWIWNDCKPANLIVTSDKSLRPIDFEGAYQINQSAPFDWQSRAFSKSKENQSFSESDDIYALGAVIYFLLTGIYYDSENPVAIKKLRRNVPIQLQTTIENLLDDSTLEKKLTASEAREKFEKVLNSI